MDRRVNAGGIALAVLAFALASAGTFRYWLVDSRAYLLCTIVQLVAAFVAIVLAEVHESK
jgi:hypothetical protein